MARHTVEHGAVARPSMLGRIWRGTKATAKAPFVTFPAAAIGSNARLIRQLFDQMRRGRQEDARFRSHRTEDGRIDLPATAFTLGLTADTLERRIVDRRRKTARQAYGSFGLGCVFVVLWVANGLGGGLSGPRLIGAVEFTPFVAIFFLVAFKYAHINWQLRTGEMGSAADYLRSPAPFLPR